MSLLPIEDIAKKAGINAEFLEPYGHLKAKIEPGEYEATKR
jgi:formyltetrahydrofolate synthetase